MTHTLHPCLWFNGQAKEAAQFYCSVFKEATIIADTPMVVNIELSGQKFMLLNGGPHFRLNPSISFFVVCESEEEITDVWEKLLENGKVMMPLDKYDWSEKYGWLEDKFGVSWQIAWGRREDVGQKFTPSLLFTGEQAGRAEEAVTFYTSVFPHSSVTGILRHSAGEGEKEGTVKHAQFSLNKYVMMVMDSSLAYAFGFNEALSFVISCDTQEEIDFYWNKLTEGGQESRCGWLKDRFGVSWQVVPSQLGKLMSDPTKADRVVKAFMQMKKLDIAKLEEA